MSEKILRFTDNNDDTVTDNLTNLMWTKVANLVNSKMSWQDALDFITKINTGNHTDWRLPSRKEIESLIVYNQCEPALSAKHPFIDVKNYYWTSSIYAYCTSDVWVVGMYGGSVFAGSKSREGHAWPVRGPLNK